MNMLNTFTTIVVLVLCNAFADQSVFCAEQLRAITLSDGGRIVLRGISTENSHEKSETMTFIDVDKKEHVILSHIGSENDYCLINACKMENEGRHVLYVLYRWIKHIKVVAFVVPGQDALDNNKINLQWTLTLYQELDGLEDDFHGNIFKQGDELVCSGSVVQIKSNKRKHFLGVISFQNGYESIFHNTFNPPVYSFSQIVDGKLLPAALKYSYLKKEWIENTKSTQ